MSRAFGGFKESVGVHQGGRVNSETQEMQIWEEKAEVFGPYDWGGCG